MSAWSGTDSAGHECFGHPRGRPTSSPGHDARMRALQRAHQNGAGGDTFVKMAVGRGFRPYVERGGSAGFRGRCGLFVMVLLPPVGLRWSCRN